MQRTVTKKLINELTYEIIGAAIEVNRILGPGLLEKNYEEALIYELNLRGLKTTSQKVINIPYKNIVLNGKLRYDVLVEDLIVVENKSVASIVPIFEATLMSYMKHLKVPKGILFNFNVRNIFKEGQKTFVNEYFSILPDT